MAIDRNHIFGKVNNLLKKENKFFSSTEILVTIGVDSFRRIAEDIEFPKSCYSSVMYSGVATLVMISNFIKVDDTKDVVFKDSASFHKLSYKSQKQIGRDQILTASPGTPENYFMEDQNTLMIYPPGVSGIIIVPYVKAPTALSNDSMTNELTENCYMASVYWTMQECMLKAGENEKSVIYATLYDKEINRLKKLYGDIFEEENDIIPHADYLR